MICIFKPASPISKSSKTVVVKCDSIYLDEDGKLMIAIRHKVDQDIEIAQFEISNTELLNIKSLFRDKILEIEYEEQLNLLGFQSKEVTKVSSGNQVLWHRIN